MIIHDCVQGTSEWLYLRAGIPTASSFDRILTPSGRVSQSAEKYMYELLAERIMRHPIQQFTSSWMERGSDMELEAVRGYEFQYDIDTVPVGFITDDAHRIGASPDRLVGDNGLLEIKVPSEGIHVSYLLKSGTAYEAYKIQCQGQLWVSEREWVDILSYHPEIPEALIRIERDEKLIQVLEKLVRAFSIELERLYAVVQERGWVKEQVAAEVNIVDAMKASLIEIGKM